MRRGHNGMEAPRDEGTTRRKHKEKGVQRDWGTKRWEHKETVFVEHNESGAHWHDPLILNIVLQWRTSIHTSVFAVDRGHVERPGRKWKPIVSVRIFLNIFCINPLIGVYDFFSTWLWVTNTENCDLYLFLTGRFWRCVYDMNQWLLTPISASHYHLELMTSLQNKIYPGSPFLELHLCQLWCL